MRSLEDMLSVIEHAQEYVQTHFPDGSKEHTTAFVNSVVYACFRITGPFGGPSVREHAAGRVINDVVVPLEEATLEEIEVFVAPIIFGPLTTTHIHVWETMRSICFNDDPLDAKTLDNIPRDNSVHLGGVQTTKMRTATLEMYRMIAALQRETQQESFHRLARNELLRLGMLPRNESE